MDQIVEIEVTRTTVSYVRAFMAARERFQAAPSDETHEAYVRAASEAAYAMSLDVNYADQLAAVREESHQ